MYEMSAQMRGQVRTVNTLKSEIQSSVDSLATRMERVERDVEYLQNKLPDTSSVEISDYLLDQQVKEAQRKGKAVIIQGTGKQC